MARERVKGLWGRRAAGCLAAVLAGGLLPEAARACAVCFGDESVLGGFTVSWLFLVTMPFAVVGAVGGWVFWVYRRSRSRNALCGTRHPAWTQKESEI